MKYVLTADCRTIIKHPFLIEQSIDQLMKLPSFIKREDNIAAQRIEFEFSEEIPESILKNTGLKLKQFKEVM